MRLLKTLIFVLLITPYAVRADSKTEAATPDLYIRGSAGVHVIPQLLLEIVLDDSPKNLLGVSESLCAGYFLNDSWSFGACGFHASVSGRGRFVPDTDFSKLGYTGAATGRGKGSVFGAGVEAEYRKRLTSYAAVFVRLGPLGAGVMDYRFRGYFEGSVIENPNVSAVVPVRTKGSHITIPIVGASTGVAFHIYGPLWIEAGPYWNSGYGGQVSLLSQFDLW